MFTEPPLARVGLSQGDAARAGIKVRTASLPIEMVLPVANHVRDEGLHEGVVAADSDRILGFTMFGAEAGEVMAVVETAMLAGMPYTGLRDAIIAHPTMAEGLNGLLARGPGPLSRDTSLDRREGHEHLYRPQLRQSRTRHRVTFA